MLTESIITLMFILFFNIFEFTTPLDYYKYTSVAHIKNGIDQNNYNELWRLILHQFYHLSTSHLLINCITFINIGVPLQDFFKMFSKYHYPLVVSLIVIFCGILNFVCHYLVYKFTSNEYYLNVNTCGFSGVLFGLQFFYHYLLKGDFVHACRILVYQLILMAILVPNVSNIGHFSGLLSGIIVGKLIKLY